MSYKFVLGASNTGKSTLIIDELIKSSLKNKDKKHIIIVPEQYTMQVQKEVIKRHPDNASFNIDILSFNRLALKIFKELNIEVENILDDISKAIIIRKLAIDNKDKLKIWKDKFKRYGFVDKIKSLISEFKQYNVESLSLEKILLDKDNKRSDILSAKLEDINLIYTEFNKFIKNKHISSEDILNILAKYISNSKDLKDAYIVYDSFTGFTPAQEKVIEELLLLADINIFALTFDVREIKDIDVDSLNIDMDDLFYMSYIMANNISKIADKLKVKKEKSIYLSETYFESEELLYLEKNLFRDNIENYYKDIKNINILEAGNREEEVKYLINEINKLVKKENYRYSDIAVLTGDLSSYADKISIRLKSENIPYHIDINLSLNNNILVDFIVAILEIVSENYSYESVMKYLKNPLSLVHLDERDINSFDNYMYTSGLKSYKKLKKEIIYLPRTYRGVGIDRLNYIKDEILASTKGLKNVLKEEVSAKNIIKEIKKNLDKLEVEKTLKDISTKFANDNNEEKAREYEGVYQSIEELLEKLDILLEGEILSKKEFLDIFKAGLHEIKLGMIPASIDSLFVGDIVRSRNKRTKVVFILGLNEGIIPKVEERYSLISDKEKEVLKNIYKLRLSPSIKESIYEQRYYSYLALTKASKKLYLSYSKMNENMESLNPSNLILELKKIFNDLEIEDIKNKNSIYSLKALEEIFVEKFNTYDVEKYLDNIEKLDVYFKEKLVDILDMAKYEYRHEDIKEYADLIFGENLSLSVSRLENYAACPYKHFLKYGLNISEREEYKFDNLDIGNISHMVLENIFRKYLKENEYKKHDSFSSYIEKDRFNKLSSSIEEVLALDEFSFHLKEARNRHFIDRLKKILDLNLKVFEKQLLHSKFKIEDVESEFKGKEKELEFKLENGNIINLKGKVDRIDIYDSTKDIENVLGDDNKKDYLALKIIDYKTGNTKWKKELALAGLQMQLVFYLGAYIKIYEKKYGKKIEPAAIFYSSLKEDYIKKEDFEKEVINLKERLDRDLEEKDLDNLREEILIRNSRPNGIVNSKLALVKALDTNMCNDKILDKNISDLVPLYTKAEIKDELVVSFEVNNLNNIGEKSVSNKKDIEELVNNVNNKIKDIATNMLLGNIEVSPVNIEKYSCEYCSYKSICSFDKNVKGYKYRKVEAE